MAKRQIFKDYQGVQVQPLAPGYLETLNTGYQPIAPDITSAGKAIGGAIGTRYEVQQQEAATKAEAAGVVDQTNTQIKQFLDSGDLVKDESGAIKPAPGKEGMFNGAELKRTLDLYNTTQGRSVEDMSVTETSSVLGRYKSGVEAAKAEREERALQLKEKASEQESAAGRARLGLELYKAANDALTQVRKDNISAAGIESDAGGINPANDAERKRKEQAAEREVDSWRRYLNDAIGPASPAGTEGRQTSASPAEPSETAVAGTPGQELDLSVFGADLTDPRRMVASTGGVGVPGTSADQEILDPTRYARNPDTGDSLRYNSRAPYSVLRRENNSVYANGNVVKVNQNHSEVRKTSVFGEMVVPGATTQIYTDFDTGKVVLALPSGTTASQEGPAKDLLIATRFANSGKVANLSISDAQRAEIKKLGYPNYGSVDSTVWERSVVASLIAQGKMQPEAGQDVSMLGRGPETHVNFEAAAQPTGAKPAGRAEFEVPPGSSVPGISLTNTRPGDAALQRRIAAGIPVTPEDVTRFRLMNDKVDFSNQVLVLQANIDADNAAARAASATAGKELAETARVYSSLGADLGAATKGYPGVFDEGNAQLGYWYRPLPSQTSGPYAGTRWTTAQIAQVKSVIVNPEASPRERASAQERYMSMLTDLNRGQVSEKALTDAAGVNADFTNGQSSLAIIRAELERQIGSGGAVDFLRTQMENLGLGPGAEGMRAAKIHQLFMMSSLRPTIAGPGNPAIYEQMLLQAAIPSVDGMLRIPKWEHAKLRTLSLISASNYVTDMTKLGLQPSQKSIDEMNRKMAAAYGPAFVPFALEDLVGPDGWVNVKDDPAAAEAWINNSRRRGRFMTRAELARESQAGR